jgi:hypothetical protein
MAGLTGWLVQDEAEFRGPCRSAAGRDLQRLRQFARRGADFFLRPRARIIPAKEWELIECGLVPQITALDLFLYDIYHDQRILKDGVMPAISSSRGNSSSKSS